MKNLKLINYVVLKDLLIMIVYLYLLRFNLTNETYTEEMVSSFPAASEMGIIEILIGSIFYSWIFILMDAVVVILLHHLIVVKIEKINRNKLLTGFLLNIPIVVFHLFLLDFDMNIAWILSILINLFFAGFIYRFFDQEVIE